MKSSGQSIYVTLLLWIIWGYNYVAIKIALESSGAFSFAALRTVISALCLIFILFINKQLRIPKNFILLMLLGLTQTSAFLGFSTLALTTGGAGETAVLTFTMPFWVLLLASYFLKEKIYGRQLISLFISFVGVMLIFKPWQLHGSTISHFYAILAGIALAVGTIIAKQLHNQGENLLSIVTWQMVFGAIPLFLMAFILPKQTIHWSNQFILALFYSAIPANALAWPMWFYLLKKVPANIASMNILAVPAFGVIMACLQLHEVPKIDELLGMLLIGMGLLILHLTPKIGQ